MNITDNPITIGEVVIFGTNNGEQHPNYANVVPAIVVQTWNGNMANLKLMAFGEYPPGAELRGSVYHKSISDTQGYGQWWLYRDEYQVLLSEQAAEDQAAQQPPAAPPVDETTDSTTV
jgi:hypothetical protein